ncbi:MAG: hypothetical protein U9R38_02465 [Candidatus Margulisiibacteriota bacterium]|nr:hypothetical protein [Candidatus Margulisiibacteriota bacterium]
MLLGGSYADEQHRVNSDFSHFWISETSQESIDLKYSRPINQGQLFDPPKTLYTFSREVDGYDIKTDENKVFITFANKDGLFFIHSSDYGRSFSSPQSISQDPGDPALIIKDNLIVIAWEEDHKIKISSSEGNQITFGKPAEFAVTGEALSLPSLSINERNEIQLLSLSTNLNTNLKNVIFAKLDNEAPVRLYQTLDEITAISSNNDLIYWQKEGYSYITPSFNQGDDFGEIIEFTTDDTILAILFRRGKPYLISHEKELQFSELKTENPPRPIVLSPKDGISTNMENLKINYNTRNFNTYLCEIELSGSNYIHSFDQVATSETNIFSPGTDIPDGTYNLRMRSFDGLKSGDYSTAIELIIDSIKPNITSLEVVFSQGIIEFSGKSSEPTKIITINNQVVSFESDLKFTKEFDLISGDNIFTFLLSDEAGNINIVTKEVVYNAASPEVTALKPEADEWFKAGSTIFIEASVFDLQEDIEDEPDAQVMINGQLLEDTLSYDKEGKTLFGFITLPEELSSGTYNGKISILDQSNNQGETSFDINIDNTPPAMAQNSNTYYSNSSDNIPIPISDSGAGIDPAGTIIKLSGASFEGTVSIEAAGIIISPNLTFLEGSYEVEVYPRDMVGNTGETISFSLVIDTTPPNLIMTGTYEPQTNKSRITLQAEIKDDNPVTVEIHNNQKKVSSKTLADSNYSAEILLFQGENDIIIKAADQAGNKANANMKIFSSSGFSKNLITNCTHGPNPFNPDKKIPGAFSTQGNGMVFSYALSQPSNIKIMIFDITGTLVWVREMQNVSSGATAWSGNDQFGQKAGNGIYPYIFKASSGGQTEMVRSKIIVFRQ